jgi:hypothetical protein
MLCVRTPSKLALLSHSRFISCMYELVHGESITGGYKGRCRLSLLTISALVTRVQMRGEGGELWGLSQ